MDKVDGKTEPELLRLLLERVKAGDVSIDDAMNSLGKDCSNKRGRGRPKGTNSEKAKERNAQMLVRMIILEKHVPDGKNKQSKIRRHLSRYYNVEETTVDRVKAAWGKIGKANRELKGMGVDRVILGCGVSDDDFMLLSPSICAGVKNGEIQTSKDGGGLTINISKKIINKYKDIESAKNSRNIMQMIGHLFE